MNVKQLKSKINVYPDDLEVWVLCEGYGNAFPAEREDVRLEVMTVDGKEKIVLLFGRE